MSVRVVPATWVRRHGRGWRCECECGFRSEPGSYKVADSIAAEHNRMHLRQKYGRT